MVCEPRSRRLWRAKKKLRVRKALAMAPIQSCAVANGDQHVLKTASFLTVIVDVAGGDRPQTGVCGEASERGNAAGIAEDEIVLQLDRDIVRSEPLDILTEEMPGVTPAA